MKLKSFLLIGLANKAGYFLVATFALIIGFYPSEYFFTDQKFGLLNQKSQELLNSIFWNIGFYTHILLGGVALFIGWIQFSSKIRNIYRLFHKRIGMLYVVAVILSSLAGIGIGFFANGGFLSSLGFICLGIIWFSTTIMAYISIKNRQIEKHQIMMVYSYAACFSAVTLRIWLPILNMLFENFITAYTIVAWLCWIPNLLVANLISKRIKIYSNT